MKAILLTLASTLMLPGCAPATASTFDGNDDLHCSVIAFYMVQTQMATTHNQARATFIMSAWYNEQIGHKVDRAKAEPVLKALKKDFLAARPAAAICVERSVRDPRFEQFARKAGRAFDQVNAEKNQ